MAHRRKHPRAKQGTIDKMSVPLKTSSENDYNSKWKDFMKFIKENDCLFNEISEQDVLDYLNHLFENKHFLPSTVEKYRSAISRPLRFWHGIDIANDEGISDFIKAMKTLVPKNPPKRPQWDLGKVLRHIEGLNLSIPANVLRKAAFLLMLATGWRISELFATQRKGENFQFLRSGALQIKPPNSFVAKNGGYRRLTYKLIDQLKDQNGEPSRLCPVAAIKKYLEITKCNETDLWLNAINKRPLKLDSFSNEICELIRQGNKGSKQATQEIRKYSATLIYKKYMNIEDVTDQINWTNQNMFYQHYLIENYDPVDLPEIRIPGTFT